MARPISGLVLGSFGVIEGQGGVLEGDGEFELHFLVFDNGSEGFDGSWLLDGGRGGGRHYEQARGMRLCRVGHCGKDAVWIRVLDELKTGSRQGGGGAIGERGITVETAISCSGISSSMVVSGSIAATRFRRSSRCGVRYTGDCSALPTAHTEPKGSSLSAT